MAPGLGYYVTPRALFGADGDFVTAPELSPLFAACIGHGVADLLAKERTVATSSNSARAAAALADEFAGSCAAARVARYRIVEPSPVLAARQRECIARRPGPRAMSIASNGWRAAAGSRGGASRSRTRSWTPCLSTVFACTPAAAMRSA